MKVELSKEQIRVILGAIQGYAAAAGITKTPDVEEVQAVLEKAIAVNPVIAPRRLADVNRFLDKVREHCSATSSDKYAADRKIEPVDAIVDWFGDGWLGGTVVKYVSRMLRTGKETDLFKAVHYLGMLYNARYPTT